MALVMRQAVGAASQAPCTARRGASSMGTTMMSERHRVAGCRLQALKSTEGDNQGRIIFCSLRKQVCFFGSGRKNTNRRSTTRARQQEVLEAHGALAQKDQVRVGRQAQLAVGSERVETLRLLRGGHALRCTQPAQWARQGWGSAFVYGIVVTRGSTTVVVTVTLPVSWGGEHH